MSHAENVTVIISTLNRSHFIAKVIRAMQDMDFGGQLLIGDSSNAQHFQQTRQYVEEMGLGYRVDHLPYPGLKYFECIREMMPMVQTRYVVSMPDDDILVPQGMEECAKFLDSNADYSAAGGVAVALQLHRDDHDRVLRSRPYRVSPVEENTAAQRLLCLLADYTVVSHSLGRTELYLERFQLEEGRRLSEESIGNELFPVSLTVVQGKVKMLDRLFVVRQTHSEHYPLKDTFDRVTNTEWQSSFQTVRDCLAMEVSRIDGIDVAEAQGLVKQALWRYLADGLSRQYQKRYRRNGAGQSSSSGDGSESVDHLRQIAKSIPGARMLWRSGRSLMSSFSPANPYSPDPYSLDALLDPSSPYHENFLPIYRAITTAPSGPVETASARTNGSMAPAPRVVEPTDPA